MRVLVTGAAGFIGFHVSKNLLENGHEVIGVDNLNEYYDIHLKEDRLNQLKLSKSFSFHKIDISDQSAVFSLANKNITHIIHLAAQAGVRHSLKDPYVYITSNVMGQTVMLEFARRVSTLQHYVYASSSSVYGANKKIPFSVQDPVEMPVSLYAATKRADELIAWTYSHLYQLPMTGLRFFTVYGPWGRPDMAAYLFTKHILANEPIKVFNQGKMRRDFTYIDDIVQGILASLKKPPQMGKEGPPVKIFNLGNSHAENLLDFIAMIEKSLGKQAKKEFESLPPGDVLETYADITDSIKELGYQPKTRIEEGVPRFIDWYKTYHKIKSF